MSDTFISILRILVVIELIATEQLIIYFCAIGKRHNLFIIFSNLILTAGMICLIIFVLSKQEGYGDGGSFNILIGAIYFIPAIFGYNQSVKRSLIIAFFSFSAGILIYSLSIRLANLFGNEYKALLVFIFQLVLDSFFAPFAIFYFREHFSHILKTGAKKFGDYLLMLVFTSFLLAVGLNSLMSRETTNVIKAIIILLFIAFLFLVYYIFSVLCGTSQYNDILAADILTDKLTGCNNRSALKRDLEKLIDKKEPFALYFMDLDNFKSVNDTFGHAVGDDYLVNYVNGLSPLLSEYITLYRLSGDEFVIVKVLDAYEQFYNKLVAQSAKIPPLKNGILFNGFSVGYTLYPKDAADTDSLLHIADMKMYRQKRMKKIDGENADNKISD